MTTETPAYALDVTPDSSLQFTLSRTPSSPSSDGGAPRCTMTLRHPGRTDQHLAFKVKTTQPRRYLVRPNQGVVAPGSQETVSILLVEKDKMILLQSYERLGQSALDHSKDKFLVQSCALSDEFASQLLEEKNKLDKTEQATVGSGGKTSKEFAEALTSFWNAASSAGADIPIFNKKLHVRHVVPTGESAAPAPAESPQPATSAPAPSLQPTERPSITNMTEEQRFNELSTLRRKYDELVAFSVNLTAERDILNNTLEQTKRDLNREMAARAALENSGGVQSRSIASENPASKGGATFVVTIMQILVVGLAAFLAGIKATKTGSTEQLEDIPVIGAMLK